MAAVDLNYATLEEALRAHRNDPPPAPTPRRRADLAAQRRRAFGSVFPTDLAQATPQATPTASFPSQGHAFGVLASAPASQDADDLELPDAAADDAHPGPAEDQVRYDRAWHVVTARIALPTSATIEDSFGTLPPTQTTTTGSASDEAQFQEALRLVLHADAALPRAAHVENLLAWHTQQVRQHYAQHVLPLLAACLGEGGSGASTVAASPEHHMAMVVNCVRTLEAAFRQYLYGMRLIARGLLTSTGASGSIITADAAVSRFQRDVHTLVAKSTPARLCASIRVVFTHFINVLLGFSTSPPTPPADTDVQARSVRQAMHELLDSLHHVGLAGDDFQILFAEMMDERMSAFAQQSFAGRWTGPPVSLTSAASLSLSASTGSSVPLSSVGVLHDWVENHFARLAHEVLGHIGRREHDAVSFVDVRTWKDVAVGRLSALRMAELFDIVLHWPRSRGGLEDLRFSVTTPPRRAQLVAAFTAAMRARLLHPACPTLEILQTYVAMIRTFHVLDPSNVLLSAVVGPLQLYLCQRDDAVRIVVDGLLAEPDAAAAAMTTTTTVADRIEQARRMAGSTGSGSTSGNNKLAELAILLNDPAQQRRRHVDDEELDWNDMEWVPDPIDAGTNYRRPKSEDVIGTLIGALGSPDAFTVEFQNIIAERLLSSQVVFAKEVKVLNLLKRRFGESALQNCEVMIRDIQDSNRLDAIIQQQQQQQQPSDVQYQAKILSRLYWPGLGREPFRLPAPVAALQTRYAAGYEQRKTHRKLAWLDQLGQARVELQLADRAVDVACKTYEAAVIYAFQNEDSDDDDDDTPVRRSVAELVEMLQMDDDLVAEALSFWQKQGVLRPDAAGESYVVVERVAGGGGGGDEGRAVEEEGDEPNTSIVDTATATATAPRSRQARADEAQRTVYWQFIVGMLTNSAASMPLAQIAMMLKMLVVGGFAWSDEELQEFLGEKTADGELEVVGGKYRLVKK